MRSDAHTVEQYIMELPQHHKETLSNLRYIIVDALPEGFEEKMNYGMITYEVPHSLYPSGYHANPSVGLIHMGISNQKNFISFYHMGLYARQDLLDWFVNRFQTESTARLDMGKSCVRFKKTSDIPFQLISDLVKKLTTEEVISIYTASRKKEKQKNE